MLCSIVVQELYIYIYVYSSIKTQYGKIGVADSMHHVALFGLLFHVCVCV